jgi:uncharacterized protein (UPF0305 family)
MVLYDKTAKYIAFLENQLPIHVYESQRAQHRAWVLKEESRAQTARNTHYVRQSREKKSAQAKIDALTRELLELKLWKLDHESKQEAKEKAHSFSQMLSQWDKMPMPDVEQDDTQ